MALIEQPESRRSALLILLMSNLCSTGVVDEGHSSLAATWTALLTYNGTAYLDGARGPGHGSSRASVLHRRINTIYLAMPVQTDHTLQFYNAGIELYYTTLPVVLLTRTLQELVCQPFRAGVELRLLACFGAA